MSSITIDRSGTESIYAACSCGWFYHEPKDATGHWKSLRLDTAINTHERVGCLKNPIAHIQVIGGFKMVALYDRKTQRFEAVSCSCGWSHSGLDFVERAELHNCTHENTNKVHALYANGEVSHDGAFSLLQSICDLDEGRAVEVMETWQ